MAEQKRLEESEEALAIEGKTELDGDFRAWLQELENAGLLTFLDNPRERQVRLVFNSCISRRLLGLSLGALCFFNDLIEHHHRDHPKGRAEIPRCD